MKCREVTVKKKRVETFRNIRYAVGRVYIILFIAERISARQPTPGHILAICVCTYVCTYVSVTLRNVNLLRLGMYKT